jgi:hypothetical protein
VKDNSENARAFVSANQDHPVPKLKLTFLICSMLFDEKLFAYHLMLQKFIEEGGLEAFFKMFRWTLTAGYTIPINQAI